MEQILGYNTHLDCHICTVVKLVATGITNVRHKSPADKGERRKSKQKKKEKTRSKKDRKHHEDKEREKIKDKDNSEKKTKKSKKKDISAEEEEEIRQANEMRAKLGLKPLQV